MDREPHRNLQLSLSEQLRQKGWQPSRKEAQRLLGELARVDRDEAATIELALRRLKGELVSLVLPLIETAVAPARARLVNLLDDHLSRPEGRALLDELLTDAEPRTQRVAIHIAGKLDGSVESQLLALWAAGPSPETRRALALALGNVGGTNASSALSTASGTAGPEAPADPELERIVAEARLKIARRTARTTAPGSIFAAGIPGQGVAVMFRCRRGLEALVAEETGGEVVGPERVELRSNRSLEALLQFRLPLDFVFPLPTDDGPIDEVVFAALTATRTRELLRRLTHGAIRFRLEWAEAGKRRASTMKLAARLQKAAPELLNDPTASLWQVDVIELPRRRIELQPKALPDPRFAYRQTDVVGASHPTIAAALAWVAEPRGGDVVWDPFAGGGTELIEIAQRTMVKELYGSDLSEAALTRARLNLDAARVPATLTRGDATTWRPPTAPTLIISNPPMGRRVLDKDRVTELLAKFLPHAARTLQPGGRLVWVTPRADDARRLAPQHGLRIAFSTRVDLGGFSAELQRLEKAR